MNLTREEEAIRIDVLWDSLADFSVEAVEFAFRKAMRELSFFPKPVELINFILEENKRVYLEATAKENPLLDWVHPTREEASELVKKYFGPLHDRWEKEDAERQEKRRVEFEEKRRKLKKQARIFFPRKEGEKT